MTRHGGIALALAALVVVVDQAAKHWILSELHLDTLGSVQVSGPFYFTMVWNQGVSFGLLQAQHGVVRWGLVLFSVVVAVLLANWARSAARWGLALGLGLVMGGAVGNAIDRARFGAVVDFIDVQRLMFPWVFNVADSAITVGVVILLMDSLRRERPIAPPTA